MAQGKKELKAFLLFLCIPVIWLGLLIAPYTDKGIIKALPDITEALNHPFRIGFSQNTVKTVLVLLLLYGMVAALFLSSQKNTRRKQEYGSATWGNVKKINSKYADPEFTKNKILIC